MYIVPLIAKGDHRQVITVLTAVQKVKKVITVRSSKVLTVLTAVQNVTIKSQY